MERHLALVKLQQLIGKDLHALARQYEVRVRTPEGKINKGWAGHVCERYLGLPINSSRSPNFGSWELKSFSLNRKVNGALRFKETMAVTMIDDFQVKLTPFEDSHLLSKLKKAVLVARVVGKNIDDPTFIHSVTALDLEGEMFEAVRNDYENIRACLNDPQRGFSALTGRMGVYIQPRTKGPGKGSVSRAFYARTSFLKHFIQLA